MPQTPPPAIPVCFVMVEPSHPGNIGAAARAMLNMGLTDLRLVGPREFPSPEASARASGADALLEGARIYSDLAEAIADCALVVGASARSRSIAWPDITPRQLAQDHLPRLATSPRLAVVFGRENSGLSNAELDLCQMRMHIPCNTEFSSLNVAAAIQVVAYEMFLASAQEKMPEANEYGRAATGQEMESFYQHLSQTLFAIGFFHARKSSPSLMRRIRHLFNRTRLRDKELHILRGILHQVECRLNGAGLPPDNPLQ